MRVLEPGHLYECFMMDKEPFHTNQILRFVKRFGDNYPGNEHGYSGTNIQEVLRCLIDRFQHLDWQSHYWINPICIFLLRMVFNLLEYRAAHRHSRKFRFKLGIENLPFDQIDGHCRY